MSRNGITIIPVEERDKKKDEGSYLDLPMMPTELASAYPFRTPFKCLVCKGATYTSRYVNHLVCSTGDCPNGNVENTVAEWNEIVEEYDHYPNELKITNEQLAAFREEIKTIITGHHAESEALNAVEIVAEEPPAGIPGLPPPVEGQFIAQTATDIQRNQRLSVDGLPRMGNTDIPRGGNGRMRPPRRPEDISFGEWVELSVIQRWLKVRERVRGELFPLERWTRERPPSLNQDPATTGRPSASGSERHGRPSQAGA